MQHTASALSEVALASAGMVSGKRLRDEIQGSNFTKLSARLDAACSKSSRTYVLVLDGLERASEAAINCLEGMARNLPENVRVLTILNSEHPDFQRSDIRRFRHWLQSENPDCIVELAGLSPENIAEWKKEVSGIDISAAVADEACEKSEGRPLMLRPWVESQDEDLSLITDQAPRFFGYYQERLMALSPEAQFIGKLLAVVYPHSLSIDVLKKASESSLSAVSAATEGLREARFCEHTGDGFRCSHSLISEYLNSNMHNEIIRKLKGKLLSAIGGMENRGWRLSRGSNRDALKADLITYEAGEDGAQFLMRHIRHLLDIGAYSQAGQKVASIDSMLGQGLKLSDSDRAKIELLRAEYLNQIGSYDKASSALQSIASFKISDNLRAKLYLELGESFFYLNRYSLAVNNLKTARAYAEKSGDVKTCARSIIRLSSITMDLGKWYSAFKVASVLEKKVLPQVLHAEEKKTECHILRTLARVYAPSDSDKAKGLVERAHKIAVDIGSDRILGNCLFAKGEVLRHAGQLEDSEESYQRSLEVGYQTGNKDLAIYSLMGIVVLAMIKGDSAKLSRYASELDSAIDYVAPVEKANAELFVAVKNSLEGGEVSHSSWQSLQQQFQALRRKWQLDLINSISENGVASLEVLSTEIQALKVVF